MSSDIQDSTANSAQVSSETSASGTETSQPQGTAKPAQRTFRPHGNRHTDASGRPVVPIIIRKPSLKDLAAQKAGEVSADGSSVAAEADKAQEASAAQGAPMRSFREVEPQVQKRGGRAASENGRGEGRERGRNGERRHFDRRGNQRGGALSSGAGKFSMPTAEEIDRAASAMAPAEDEDFASLLAASGEDVQRIRRFEVGEKVTGVIVQLSGERAFLDLGGKGEGMIEASELKDRDGELAFHVGDSVEAYVLKTGGGIVLTRSIPKGALRELIVQAAASGIPVDGTVTAVNKGGFEVDLGSGSRGFCPISQMDDHYVEDAASYVGQRLSFRVTEVKDRDIVLSRRALLEEEKAARAAALREQVVPGARFHGKVTSVRDFGAFVDLGGIEGLVHVSEMAFSRVARASDILSVGQEVEVEVLRVEAPKPGEKGMGRISLSMKAVMDDPWDEAMRTLAEGDKVEGTVVRLQPFGAFVEILPGVDGLIHISALGAEKRISHPKEVVSEGERVQCVIESIDPEARRIALRRLTGDESLDEALSESADSEKEPSLPQTRSFAVGDTVEVTVEKAEPYGLFVTFEGTRGFVPAAETGTIRGTDLRKAFPAGTTFKAEFIESDAQGRLRLSKSAAEKSEERREVEKYLKTERQAAKAGFGTFADLFKKMKK